MLTGGASVFYASELASNAKNAIFLRGYQDAESTGRRLQELKSGDALPLGDITVEVKCRVERFRLSAHSDQQQLMNMIRQASPKALALVHAEPEVAAVLRERVYKNHIMYSPVNGKVEDGKTFHIPDEIAGVERWKTFALGEHTARLKGNQLVITKREG